MEHKLYHSAAYYPELWPLTQIDADLAEMKAVGLNAVRIGEFAWSRLEPEEGRYDFDWLQLVLDKLQAVPMHAILCTPTPTPPAWLTEKYPEMLFVNRQGRTMIHGARRHYCYNSPIYRAYAGKITEQLAQRFGKHPALIGWQTDNEFFCHVEACFCPGCKNEFHHWLEQKYQSIDNLNRAWGTHIWSEYYNHWAQIPQPFPTAAAHNPSLETAYLQFASESMVAFQKVQLDIIRAYSSQPITHNGMPPFHHLDYDALFADLDFPSMDAYIDVADWWRVFFEFDWMRSKLPARFWMIETDPGWNGGGSSHRDVDPAGFVRMKGLATYGFGGQGISYWLWRQQRTGCEMVHGSVIYAWGKPTPRWPEIHGLSNSIPKIETFITETALPPAEIALHYSNRGHIMLDVEPLANNFQFYQTWFNEAYRPLLATGLFRDVIFETAPVDNYRIVFTPFLPVFTEALLQKMQRFVEHGGIWMVGPMSAYRTPEHTVPTNAALGAFETWAGVPTTYSFPLTDGKTRIRLADGTETVGKYWGFSFGDLSDAQSLGKYTTEPAPNQHWGYVRTIGNGKLIVLGSVIGTDVLQHFLSQLFKTVDFNHHYTVSWGTTVAPRIGKTRAGLVIVNWDGHGGWVTVPQPGVDLLSGKSYQGEIQVGSFEVLMLEYQ
ncbi:beta-galactosidase [candidate division KSB1 bacterium]|nr:beta-galactosidase [candidate division KSB1 bacterium]